jgi:hypothetical protein
MTTEELCQRTRTTPRAIQWWCEKYLIECRYTDRGFRDFDLSQALTAAIVAELRYKGLSLHRIRRLGIAEPLGAYLVVTGEMAVWCGEQDVIPCLAACAGACLVVSVEDLRKKLYDQDPPRFSRRARN